MSHALRLVDIFTPLKILIKQSLHDCRRPSTNHYSGNQTKSSGYFFNLLEVLLGHQIQELKNLIVSQGHTIPINMSLTTSGKTTTKENSSPPKSTIIVRQARLWEGYRIGEIAAKTYYDAPLTAFLSPYREKYSADYIRTFSERAQRRLLDPRNLSFVACEASDPSYAIAYAQFVRVGDDEGFKKQIASRKSLWLWVLSWLYWAYCKAWELAVGDKSADPKAMAEFESWITFENSAYWDEPERENRWHAQSVVVGKEFQGRGIGKLLLREAMERAESEGVCVGLEASPPGEHLYRSLGFEILGRFNEKCQAIEGGPLGGYMMWSPSSWTSKGQ